MLTEIQIQMLLERYSVKGFTFDDGFIFFNGKAVLLYKLRLDQRYEINEWVMPLLLNRIIEGIEVKTGKYFSRFKYPIGWCFKWDNIGMSNLEMSLDEVKEEGIKFYMTDLMAMWEAEQ